MLEELVIRNLAVVASARLRPAPGLTVISGTTGGGKSLIVAALKLLRGERAAASVLRAGADHAAVDGVFRLAAGERSAAVRALLGELLGEAPEDDLLILSRIVEPGGRSRAFLNGRPVTVAALQRVGSFLLEIHGQGESALLFRSDIQAEMLDHIGGLRGSRAAFAAALERARRLARDLEERARGRRELRDRTDLLAFQHQELSRLDPRPGELSRLEGERRIAANLERLRELLGGAAELISEGEESLLERLGQARHRIGEAAALDSLLAGPLAALEEAGDLLKEAGRALVSRLHSLAEEPGRLDRLEERIALIRAAMARFSRDEEGLLRLGRELAAELERLQQLEAGGENLPQELELALAEAARLGRDLVHRRRLAARRLCREVEADLADLGMEKARLGVAVGECAEAELLARATAHGPGPVEFLLRANPGEEERSLARVASGGERARVMLALKRRLADADTVPVLVLDEIDAEVGGRLGGALGRKLKEVSASHQLLCVTHLPQVAAYGDAHYLVRKEVRQGRTFALAEELQGEARDRELAAMSRGDRVGSREIEEARRLRGEAAGGAPGPGE